MKYLILVIISLLINQSYGKTRNEWIDKPIDFEIKCFSRNKKEITTIIKKLGFGKVLKVKEGYILEFDNPIIFKNVTFKENASFSNVTFHDSVSFVDVRFKKYASFNWTEFLGYTNFYSQANFEMIGANNLNISFDYTTFYDKTLMHFLDEKRLSLNRTTLKNKFELRFLPLELDFSNVNIEKDILIKLNYGLPYNRKQKCDILLSNTDCSKVILNPFSTNIIYDEQQSLDENLYTYEKIIATLRKLGYQDSAMRFDIIRQKQKIKKTQPSISFYLIWFKEYWSNFGYKTSNIFRNTAYTFFTFFVIFIFSLKAFISAYFPKMSSITSDEINALKWNSINNLSIRLKVALFYTALIFFSWKMEHEKLNFIKYPIRAIFIYFVYIVGIIHLAYLAGEVLR